MRIKIWILALLLAAFPLFSQNYRLGGALGVGSNVTDSDAGLSDSNFEPRELHFGWYKTSDTILTFRAGQLEPGSDISMGTPDFTYYALTVDYLFYDEMFSTGFYLGPAYYDGEVSWKIDSGDVGTGENQFELSEESQLGVTGGVETFIPVLKHLDLFLTLSAHYIPLDREHQIYAGVLGGLSIKF